MRNNRSLCLFSALMLLAGQSTSQSILPASTGKASPSNTATAAATAASSPAPAPAAAVAAVPPLKLAATAAAVPIAVSSRSSLSIAEIANQQARSLADEAEKKVKGNAPVVRQAQVVPELIPVQAIGVVMDKDAKPNVIKVAPSAPPLPPRPYLASVIGMAGQEVAEVHTGSSGRLLREGDSIGTWRIVRVTQGKVFLSGTSLSKGKKKPVSTERVLSVGEFL